MLYVRNYHTLIKFWNMNYAQLEKFQKVCCFQWPKIFTTLSFLQKYYFVNMSYLVTKKSIYKLLNFHISQINIPEIILPRPFDDKDVY